MPVTIPPFTDVPSPGDPVASAWAQSLTQFAVDQIVSQPGTPTSPNTELWYDTDDAGMSFPNMPRGYVAHAAKTSAETINTVNTWTDVAGLSVSWTADPTRRYKTTYVISAAKKVTASGLTFWGIFNESGGQVTALVADMPTVNLYYPLGEISVIESGLSGTITRKGRVYTSTAGVLIDAGAQQPCLIVVEDIGSAGQSGGGVWSDKFPRGILARNDQSTADQTLTSAGWQDVTGAGAVTFSLGSTRWVKFSYVGTLRIVNATAVFIVGIHNGTTQFATQEIAVAQNAAGFSVPFNLTAAIQLNAGTYSYKPQMYANGTGGTLMGLGGRNSKFLIEDIGAM